MDKAHAVLSLSRIHPGLSEKDLEKLLPTHDFETELLLRPETSAYWHAAQKGIIDNVPSAIYEHFTCKVGSEAAQTLMKDLGVHGEDARTKCAEFLAEDQEIVERRAELVASRNRLEQGLSAVRKFKGGISLLKRKRGHL